MYSLYFKRFFDILFSIIGLIVLSPLLLFTFFLLLFSNNTNAFFTQLRPGRKNIIFKLIKFKTMNDNRDKKGNLLPDEIRLTPIGKLVRKLSIDELPQLINVLKGDMSLIGPRPLLPEYLEFYTPEQARRHEVRPGITGWAQVNGRNTLSWEKKFEYDVWYVDNLSLKLDVKILWLTIIKVFKREGISSATSATMERFDILNNKNV